VPGVVLLTGGAGASRGRQVRLKSFQTSGFRKSAMYFSSMMFSSDAGKTRGAEPKLVAPYCRLARAASRNGCAAATRVLSPHAGQLMCQVASAALNGLRERGA